MYQRLAMADLLLTCVEFIVSLYTVHEQNEVLG